MKRKIFTSLLVAPLALNALADATVNGDLVGNGASIWKTDGVTGTQLMFGDKTALCSVAGGSIERTLANINPGTYQIVFGEQDNVKVLVDGKLVPLVNKVAVFEVEKTGNVTLKITSSQVSRGFSFSDAKLILVFDFKAAMESLNSSLADVTLSEVPADELIPEAYHQEAEGFRTQRATLETQMEGLKTDISELDATDDNELLKIYNKYELWKGNSSKLQSRLDELSGQALGFNEKLAAAIEKWNHVTANTAALEALNSQIAGLQDLIDAAESKVEGVTKNPNVKGNRNDAKTYIASKVLSKDAQASLDAYKNAVHDAYSDLEKADVENPDGFANVKSECEALAGQFTTALETWNAYSDVTKLQAEVTAALSDNLAAIDALSGVKEKENNFDDYKGTVKTTLNTIYADAISKLVIKVNATTIDDNYTMENALADTKILNGALLEMQEVVENAKKFVDEQNQLYTDYNVKLKEDQENLDNCKDKIKLPEEQQKELDNLIKDAQDAITALEKTISDAYKAGGDAYPGTPGLAADAYATEFSDIDVKVKAVSDYIAQWQPIVTIIGNFEDLKTYIKGLQEDSKIPEEEFDLYGKFHNNIDHINAAIEDLKNHPNATNIKTRLEETQEAIDQTKQYAEEMMNAYVAAAAAVKGFGDRMTDLDNYIAEKKKTIVEGNEYKPDSFKEKPPYTTLNNELQGFLRTLKAIQKGEVGTGPITNQDVYNKAIKLAEDIKKYDVDTHYYNVLKSFETEATESNYNFVETAIERVKTAQADGEYAGKDDVGFDKVDGELAGIRVALDKEEGQEVPNVPAFKKIDNDLSKLLVEVKDLEKEVQDLKDNQKAYDELWNGYTAADFSKQIKELLIYNQNSSLAPAVDHYNALIGSATSPAEGSLYDQNEKLKDDIKRALDDRTAFTNYRNLKNAIDNLQSAITNMYAAIDDNNAAYKGQMAESDLVRTTIDGILKTLQEADEKAGAVLTSDWQTQLTELRNTDLTAVDVAASGYYGEGLSKTYDRGENIGKDGVKGIMNRYEEILKKANDIKDAFEEDYGDRVVDTNKATVEDAHWTTDLTSMVNKYEAAIQQYNAFYALTNANYRTYILGVVGTHKVIFDYYKAIKDVEAKMAEWVKGQNDGKIAFAPEAFNKACVEAVNDVLEGIDGAAVDPQPADPTALNVMTASIDNRVNKMLADANTAAKVYYNGNGADRKGIHPVAEEIVTKAETDLRAANIDFEFSTALTAARKNLQTGEDYYTEKNEEQSFALTPMDDIANYFEEIPNPIALQPAAVAQWNKYYEDASETLDSLTQKLEGLKGHSPDVETALKGKVDAALALNNKALAKSALIDSIVTYKSELDKILEDAQKIVSDEETRVKDDEENGRLAEQYAVILVDLESELSALKVYAAALMGGQGMTFENISSLIADYKTLVTETYPHALKDHEQDITDAIEDVRDAIANGYTGVRNNESVALNNLLDMVKVAFNDAFVAEDCILSKEQLDKVNAEVETLKPKVYGLPGIEDNMDFQASALELETALSGYYVQLKESYGDKANEATALLAALESRYNTIAGNITAGNDDLSKCGYQSVIDVYTDDYNNLQAALDKLQVAWAADGNKIVMTADGYNKELDAIESKLAALAKSVAQAKKDAKDEQDRIDANNLAYERLTGELDAIEEQFGAVKETVEEYGLTEELQNDIDDIESLLAQTITALENAYKGVELTAESKLENGDDIKSDLTGLNVKAEKMNCNSKINDALGALEEANEEIGKKVVPEIKQQLLEQYSTLYGRYSQGYNEYQSGILGYNEGAIEAETLISTLKDVNAVMDEIITQAGEIKTSAAENIFVPGNVDLDADGVVNSADLQTLIGWIGRGVTYEELYADSPLKAAAANIVGDDVINIADATALVQIILDEEQAESDPAGTQRRLAYRRGVQTSESIYGVALISNEHGSRQYALSIDNGERFIGGQLDVKLPLGMTLTEVQATDRAAGHEVMVFDNGNGWYRIVLISTDNAEITGNSGALLILSTEGVGTPAVEGVVFSDTENTAVCLKQSSQSMIDTVMDYTRNGIDRIYNVAGQTMRSIQNGINIIRHSNGKTTKELRK